MAGIGSTMGLHDRVYFKEEISKMKSKRLLALALSFCVAFPGAMPAAASLEDAGTADLQAEQTAGDITDGTEDLLQEAADGDDAQAWDGASVSDDVAAPEGPVVSADGTQGEPEGPTVSGDATPGDTITVISPKWVKDGEKYRLVKSNGSGYYTEQDGLVEIDRAYYAFDAEGYMLTGAHERTLNVEKAGVYYFLTAQECPDVEEPSPENSQIGQLATGNGWRQVAGEDRWLFLKGGLWDSSKTGKQEISNVKKTYYLDEKDGTVVKDAWKEIDGKTYYFDAEGVMAAGCFVNVGEGKQYYYGSDGKRLEATGWQRLNGSFYYFAKDHSRVIKTGWQKIKEDKESGYYYFTDTGEMYTSKLFKVDDYRFYVDGTGMMLTGWQEVDGKKYFFRKKAEGAAPIGSAYSGWKKQDGRWYYFKSGNQQAVSNGLVKISKQYYFFDKNARMYKGGWKTIDGKLYHFQKQTNKARKGYADTKIWLKKGGEKYYASSKGAMLTDSWLKYKGDYYYLDEDGVMLTDTWKQRSGKWGYLNKKGVFSQKWVKVDGKWKYAQTNGKFAKGWTYLVQNGTRYKYYFDKKGFLSQDVRGKVSGPYMLRVDRVRNQITVYARDTNGQYNIPVVAMPCSVGLPATPTPKGRFTGSRAGRWQILMGPSWGQYATLVDAANGIFIHSVSGPAANPYSLPANEWNKLGRTAASHGCIRVAVIDAKWIYEHCNGSTIEVQDYSNAGPFDRKTYTKITAAYNWDPTDPAAKGYL